MPDADTPAVATHQGEVRGVRDRGTESFRGIPFAAPPIGQNRFAAPRPPEAWCGIREANEFAPSPAQARSPFLQDAEFSEDSLYLNVWTPASGTGSRPVLVWVYGGGFAGGTASTEFYNGARLAEEGDVVVVTANHRVGALGFALLAHRSASLSEATNLGIRDVIATLEWIRANISAFGGDPASVTVMGQSSGAFISAALLAAPAADGLFTKLILLSGGASRIVPLSIAQELGDDLIARLDIDDIESIRALSWEQIVAAQQLVGSQDIGVRNAPAPASLGVVLDGAVVARHPLASVQSGRNVAVPILVAATGAEVAGLRNSDLAIFAPTSIDALIAEVESWGISGERAVAIVRSYDTDDESSPQALGLVRERLLTDWIYRLPAVRLAEAHARVGGHAWLAQLDDPDGLPGAHGAELGRLFGSLALEPAEEASGRDIRDRVLRFVTAGDPGWPEYDNESATAALFGPTTAVTAGLFAGALATWAGIERP